MAHHLEVFRREGHDVVVVIGASHHNGLQNILEDLQTRDTGPEISVSIRLATVEMVNIPIG